MILQILASTFSLLGYYFISKNPKYAYICFIILNSILLLSNFQFALVINIIFSVYFLINVTMEKDILIKLSKKYPNDQEFGYYVRTLMNLQEEAEKTDKSSCKCGENCKCRKEE